MIWRRDHASYFPCKYPNFSVTYTENTIISPLICNISFVTNQRYLYLGSVFRFFSISMIYFSFYTYTVLMIVHIKSLGIRQNKNSHFVFVQKPLESLGDFNFHIYFKFIEVQKMFEDNTEFSNLHSIFCLFYGSSLIYFSILYFYPWVYV